MGLSKTFVYRLEIMQYACSFAVTATVFPAEDKYTQLVEMKNFFKIYKYHILLSFYYFFIIILPFVFIYIYTNMIKTF